MTDAAIEALGALAGQLPWVQYEQLLNQWLKVMKKSATKVQAELPLLHKCVVFACLLLAHFNHHVSSKFLTNRYRPCLELAGERYMARCLSESGEPATCMTSQLYALCVMQRLGCCILCTCSQHTPTFCQHAQQLGRTDTLQFATANGHDCIGHVLCRWRHSLVCVVLAVSHAWGDVHVQAIVRGVCAIIDAFHFDISSPAPDLEEGTQGAEGEGKEEEALQEDGEAAASCQAEAESAHKAIQSALTRRVLPGLRAQLVHDGEVSYHIQYLHSPETAAACSSLHIAHVP